MAGSGWERKRTEKAKQNKINKETSKEIKYARAKRRIRYQQKTLPKMQERVLHEKRESRILRRLFLEQDPWNAY